jgi:hypothetical protein
MVRRLRRFTSATFDGGGTYVLELERHKDGAGGGSRRAQEGPNRGSLSQDEEREQNHKEQLNRSKHSARVSRYPLQAPAQGFNGSYRARLDEKMEVDCGRQMEAPVREAQLESEQHTDRQRVPPTSH